MIGEGVSNTSVVGWVASSTAFGSYGEYVYLKEG
jgi:hypothetical protein